MWRIRIGLPGNLIRIDTETVGESPFVNISLIRHSASRLAIQLTEHVGSGMVELVHLRLALRSVFINKRVICNSRCILLFARNNIWSASISLLIMAVLSHGVEVASPSLHLL